MTAASLAGGDEIAVHVIPRPVLTGLIDAEVPLLLIDTRAPIPYGQGHIPTAVNIPGYLFEKKPIPSLPDDLDQPLATYCSGGHCGISWYAAERLLDFGYRRVLVFQEGVDGWRQSGQMLVTERHEQLPRISKADLKALLATGARVQLRDARPAAAFAGFSLPRAVNLPVENCRPHTPGMPPSLDELVVVFGQGKWDGHAYHVADRLRAWGYQKVRLFTGGVNDWRKP